MRKKSGIIQGFTLVELLIYAGLLVVIGGIMAGILVSSLKIGQRESASGEVTEQLNFTLKTLERLIRGSSNIDIAAGVSTSTLVLRMASGTEDPTIVFLQNGALVLQQGNQATTSISTNKVVVDSISFKKFTQYPGHDTVSIDMTMTYNSENPESYAQRSLSSAIARVSAATFDSDLVPGSAYTYKIGQAGSPWQNIYMGDGDFQNPSYTWSADTNTGFSRLGDDILGFITGGMERMRIDSAGKIGIATSTPTQPLTVFGMIYSSKDGFKFPDGSVQVSSATTISGGTRVFTANNSTFTVPYGVTKVYVTGCGGGGGGGGGAFGTGGGGGGGGGGEGGLYVPVTVTPGGDIPVTIVYQGGGGTGGFSGGPCGDGNGCAGGAGGASSFGSFVVFRGGGGGGGGVYATGVGGTGGISAGQGGVDGGNGGNYVNGGGPGSDYGGYGGDGGGSVWWRDFFGAGATTTPVYGSGYPGLDAEGWCAGGGGGSGAGYSGTPGGSGGGGRSGIIIVQW